MVIFSLCTSLSHLSAGDARDKFGDSVTYRSNTLLYRGMGVTLDMHFPGHSGSL